MSIAALAVASATFLFIATPTDLIRDRVVQEVRQRTGRDLSVAGGSSLSVLNGLGVRLHDVSLSSPPEMAGEPMARVAEIDVRIPFWSLIRGELLVERLVLKRPALNLRVDADGRRSWTFDRPNRKAGTQRGAGGGAKGSDLAADLRKLPVANVLIEDGTVTYVNEKREIEEEISSLDLEIGVSSLDSRLEATGDLTLRDQQLEFRGSLNSISTLLDGSPSELALHLIGQPLEANYEGTIALSPATRLAGTLTVQSGSLQALASWFDASVLEGAEDGPVALSGKLETTPASVSLTEADAQIGSTTIKGLAVLETRSGIRPRLSADLQVSQLDLGYWITPTGKPASDAGDGRATTGDQGEPRSIDDLLRGTQTDKPQVRGFIARHGWSDVPFELNKLDIVDADVKLLIDRLIYRDVEAGVTRITATLADRSIDVSIDEMQLYGGAGRGTVRLDTSGSAAALKAELQVENVSTFDLLRDAAEFDWVDGKGEITLTITGDGRTEREIVETLDGKAEFAFRDGALVGVDIPGIIDSLQQGRIPRLERNAADRTRFSALTASFSIQDGIATNRDLQLDSELVDVTGSGTADLPHRTLDYTIRPMLVTTRRSGDESPAGLEVPIRITGSWDHPTYAADLDAVLKNPGDVVEAVKEIGKQLKGKNLEEALDSLLGGDDGDSDRKKPKARDLLRQFLKP